MNTPSAKPADEPAKMTAAQMAASADSRRGAQAGDAGENAELVWIRSVRYRRPLVAILAMTTLVILEAVLDPTGLLALVGFPGGTLHAELIWPTARYVIFMPVLLVMVFWTALRGDGRFWSTFAGIVLGVTVAQQATVLVMTGDILTAGWSGAYVLGKAVPAGLLVAAATRVFGQRGGWRRRARTPMEMRGSTSPTVSAPSESQRESASSATFVWCTTVTIVVVALLAPGSWWTSAAYPPGVPTPRPEHGSVLVVLAVALLVPSCLLGLRWARQRVPGALGTWIGSMVGGGLFAGGQAVLAVVFDDGFRGDLWPLLSSYLIVADGAAFGTAAGSLTVLVTVVCERIGPVLSTRWSPAIRRTVGITLGAAVTVAALVASGLLNVQEPRADAAIPDGYLGVRGGRVVDSTGNQVLLRGVNVNQLVDFYQPRSGVPATRPLSAKDFSDMAALGFDVVRLTISWSALEPVRGRLDPAYLARIREAIDWAKADGMRTVIDMHQDGWSNMPTRTGTSCRPGTDPMWGYDGAPGWATITDGAPRCSFTGRDISPAGDRAFEHFWFDTDGIRTALATTWGKLAAEFRDEPAVAGFDLINEPGFGETAPATTSLNLGEFYAAAIGAIRTAGAPQIVFIEPSILWSGLGIDAGPRRGFTDDPNVVFSPHLYAESITLDASLGLPTIVSTERQFALAQRIAHANRMALWSGEYGYWGDRASIHQKLNRYAAAEDRNVIGGAYWVWKQACGDPQNGIGPIGLALVPEDCATGADGDSDPEVLRILSRPYPKTAPGRVLSLRARNDGSSPELRLTGSSSQRSCRLDVWVPGEVAPRTSSTGVEGLQVHPVTGGWRITGCVSAEEYSLRVG